MANNNLKLTIHFFNEEPSAAARKLDQLEPARAAEILHKVPISVASKVIFSMLPSVSASVLSASSADFNSSIFNSLELADIAAILRYVSISDRQSMIEMLPKSRQALCKLLISYPENTVGTLIETNVLVIDNQMTVAEAMLRVKKQTYFESHEVLIVNNKRRIVGKVSLFDLLRTHASTPVSALASVSVDTVNGLSDVSTVLELDIWQKTDSIAVINRKQEFIGILRHCDLRASITRIKKAAHLPYSVTDQLIDTYSSVLGAVFEMFTQPKDIRH